MADIVFLVDESSSIGQNNFLIVLKFLKDLISSLNVGKDTVRVGLVTFAKIPTKVFDLNQYYNTSEIDNAIDAISYGKGGTEIGDGLDFVRKNIFTVSGGDRDNVQNYIILVSIYIQTSL